MSNTRHGRLRHGARLLTLAGTLAAGLVTLASCTYSHVEMELRITPRGEVDLRPDSIELEVGLAAVITVIPYDSGNRTKRVWDMDLYSQEDSIVEVVQGTELRDYLVQAHSVGETCIEVWWKHEMRECISVTVTPPLP